MTKAENKKIWNINKQLILEAVELIQKSKDIQKTKKLETLEAKDS